MRLPVARSLALVAAIFAGGAMMAGCAPPEAAAPTPPKAAAPAVVPVSDAPLVIVLGDSLAAGYGLGESEAFPSVLAAALRAEGKPVRMLNAGVSGDTTAGGLERLDWLLRQRPSVVVLELGANDGLRGLPLAQTEANLRALVERCRAAGAKVLLVGMQVPTNMGADYAGAFAAIFPRVASEAVVPLVPFLLEGVALVPQLNQPDGIHPTAEGQRLLAETVLPHLRAIL